MCRRLEEADSCTMRYSSRENSHPKMVSLSMNVYYHLVLPVLPVLLNFVLHVRYNIYKDHITLEDYEIHDGMGLELYYN